MHRPPRAAAARLPAAAFVFAATFAAFIPALRGRFLIWDDETMLVHNAEFLSHGWKDIGWMLTTTHMANYQPLSWATYGVDYALWGLNPLGFHLTNNLLHALSAALFFFLCLRLIGGRKPGDRDLLASAGAALFFALHPLRAESVTWISERRDVLSGAFFLLTLLAYLRSVDEPKDRALWLSLSCTAYALSLMAKTVAVTLPAVLVVLDLYVLKRRAWKEKLPFALLALGMASIGIWAQSNISAVLSYEHMGLTARLCQAAFALGFYLFKTILPLRLSPFYELSRWTDPGLYLACGALAAAVGLYCWRTRTRTPALWAAWLSYFLIVFPLLGFIKTGEAAAADRYTYLSCLPWALLLGAALKKTLAPAAALVLLAGMTWNQAGIWHDSISLWSQAVVVDPASPFARNNLAAALERAGRPQEAAEHRRLGQESPARPFHEEGEARYERGDFIGAAESFYRAVEITPNLPATQNNLGLSLYRLGRFSQAAEHFEFAVRLSSGNPGFEKNLAAARARLH